MDGCEKEGEEILIIEKVVFAKKTHPNKRANLYRNVKIGKFFVNKIFNWICSGSTQTQIRNPKTIAVSI